MKRNLALLVICLFFTAATGYSQSVGINNPTPDPSAILDISATDKGLLIPRLDSTQRLNILNPATGLMVYDSSTMSFWYYDSTWLEVSSDDSDIWLKKGTIESASKSDTAIYFPGNVAIGKDTSSATLNIYSKEIIGLNIHQESESKSTPMGIRVVVEDKDAFQQFGMRTELRGDAKSRIGNYIISTNNDSITNFVVGNWTRLFYSSAIEDSIVRQSIGSLNDVQAYDNVYVTGTRNILAGSGFGIHRGTRNEMDGSGDAEMIGTSNEFGQTSSGTGIHIGTKNELRGDGPLYGTYQDFSASFLDSNVYATFNEVDDSSFDGSYYGLYNDVNISGNINPQYGVYNQINGSNMTGAQYGSYTELGATGSGAQYGSFQFLNNSGSGSHYGVASVLAGNASGEQIGTFNSIGASGDGLHIGTQNLLAGNGNGEHRGSQSILSGGGSGEKIGHYVEITEDAVGNKKGVKILIEDSSSGNRSGISTTIYGSGNGTNAGMVNSMYGQAGLNGKLGIVNNMENGGGSMTGVRNNLRPEEGGDFIGTHNFFAKKGSNTVNGNVYGSKNELSISGGGTYYGTQNQLITTGNGTHYGTYNYVFNTVGEAIAGYFYSHDRAAVFDIGDVVINESGSLDSDLRVESDNNSAILFVDASADAIGLGTQSPERLLDIRGTGQIKRNSSGSNPHLIVHENANDFARISFQSNDDDSYWTLAGRPRSDSTLARFNIYSSQKGNVLSVQGDGDVVVDERLVVGASTPEAALHANSSAGTDALRVKVNGSTKMRVYENGSISLGGNWGSDNPAGTDNNVFITSKLSFGITDPLYRLEIQNSTTPSVGRGRANAWVTYSDARVKKNVSALTYGLEEVLALRPVNYDHYSSSFGKNGLKLKDEYAPEIGFLAQDVYEVVKEVVQKPENESNDLWTMDYEKLTPVLVKAIQEQQKIIENLKAQQAVTNEKLELIMSALDIKSDE